MLSGVLLTGPDPGSGQLFLFQEVPVLCWRPRPQMWDCLFISLMPPLLAGKRAASEHEVKCPARALALLVHSVPGVRNRARLPGVVARATRRICERKLLRMFQGSATVSSLREQSPRQGAKQAGKEL